MGVHGLWKLIEPSGKPVPLETLENKVLAVDVSIWLHHFIKGFQDGMGAPVPNAHLLGIYHRLCKLLYFRIKPVFVFDGGVPALKKRTMEIRNQRKSKNLSEADRIHKNLLSALVKHSAISKVLSEKAKAAINAQTSPTKKTKFEDDNLYVLPPTELDSTISSSDEEVPEEDSDSSRQYDLHSIDTKSAEFKSLPVEVRHEILTDLKDTRKQSSWGRINQMPTHTDDFSSYQMNRLLKRQSVQTALEEAEKEMGGHSLSLGELEKILKDQGVISNNVKGNRIASDENTRFLLIKDIKQAVEDARKQNLEDGEKAMDKGDQELDENLAKAIALSLEEMPSTSKDEPSSSTKGEEIRGKGKRRMPLSFLADFNDADFDFDSESSEEETVPMRLTPAQRYMMEYSDLTPSEIAKILGGVSKKVTKKEELSKVVEVEEERVTDRTSLEENEVKVVTSSDGQSRNGAELPTEEVASNFSSKESEEAKRVNPTEEVVSDFSSKESEAKAVSPTKNKDEVKIISDSGSSSNDDFVEIEESNEPEKSESPNEEKDVEVMSDSGSSSNDDFVEVEESNQPKPTPSMEVVIKPDEEVDDDLFKDIFEEKVENPEKDVSNTATTILKNIEKPEERETTKLDETKEQEKEEIELPKVNVDKTPKEAPKLTIEQLTEMKDNLRKEQVELAVARSTKERLASNITDQMYQEAQELLELFGVPYVIAPMEAEAQCAFLELINLTDGTITDDSDIWLFGGRTVYKNFFNQSKYVLEFKSESIQKHYKLTREQMILLAMLVGSDYTIGLQGVGPVTALEILASFPPKKQLISGLAEFKSWFQKGMMAGRKTLRSKLKNVNFSDNFPNPQIVEAYLDPKVETSKEKFSWAKPDVIGLVDFAKQRFGWTKTKTDEILNPVLKKLEETRSQKPITDYFKYQVKVDSGDTGKVMSKRVKNALERIEKGDVEDEPEVKKKRAGRKKQEDEEIDTVKEGKKRVRRKKQDEEIEVKKKTVRRKKQEDVREVEDEEIKILKEVEAKSAKRLEEIKNEVHKEVEQQKKKINFQRLHKKEVITQKQKDKADMLKNKLRAIETFRKSKQGPGFVKKGSKTKQQPKNDASYLSEGSSSD